MEPQHRRLGSPAVAQSWRLWLLTGARREPADRRRLRGAHLGLKRALLEDSSVRGEPAYGWKEFSDAMLRHAIGDAIGMLPDQDETFLKLAYFGGFSNRDIAAEFGVTEAAVASRLRRAMDAISERIQRGGATIRKAAFAIAAWFGGRWCETWLHRAAEAAAVAAVAAVVTAGAPATAIPAPDRSAAPPQTQSVRSEVMSAALRDAAGGPDSPAPPVTAGISPVAPALPGTPSLPSVPQIEVVVPQVTTPVTPPAPVPSSPIQVPLRA